MERLSLTTRKMRRMMLIGAASATGLLSGCVNVTAPDKPIEINLNINITQQVVYKLDGQAKALIDENPGIF
jgi:outer membrane murein-binding lipoprotein Lpp